MTLCDLMSKILEMFPTKLCNKYISTDQPSRVQNMLVERLGKAKMNDREISQIDFLSAEANGSNSVAKTINHFLISNIV